MRNTPFLLPSQNPKPANPSSRPLPAELTEEMFTAYIKMVEWILSVRLSAGQKAHGRRILQDYFLHGNAKGIRSVQTAWETYQDLMEKEPVTRSIEARRNLPHSLQELREKAEGQESEAKWLLSVYHAAFPTIAPGDPPLTRDVADAWIAMDHLLRTQLWNHRIPPLNPVTRARYDRKMTIRWKTLSKEERYKYMRLPGEFIEGKHKFPNFTPKDRHDMKLSIYYDAKKRAVLLEEVEDPMRKL